MAQSMTMHMNNSQQRRPVRAASLPTIQDSGAVEHKQRSRSNSLMTSLPPMPQSGEPQDIAPGFRGMTRKDSVTLVFGQLSKKPKWYARTVHPHSVYRGLWDLLVLFLLVYCGLSIPFRIAFSLWPLPGSFEEVFEFSVDACFWLDILLNFRTGIYVEGRLVTSARAIALDYLKVWFWIDFFSVLPIADLVGAVLGDDSASELRLIRMIRICRLVRIVRMMRVFDRWSKHIYINSSISRSFKFLFVLLCLAHTLSCLWFWSSGQSNGHGEETWVSAYYFEGRDMSSYPGHWHADDNDHLGQVWNWYSVCFYWAIMTVTTVGYGDITPFNDFERLMAAFAMLVGGMTYAYVVGNIAVLVQNYDPMQKQYDHRIMSVNNYMVRRKFPRRLQIRIREHFDHCFRTELLLADEDSIYADLSPDLQREMLDFLNLSMLASFPVFEKVLDQEFVDELSSEVSGGKVVYLRSYTSRTVILGEGQRSPHMFYIRTGVVDIEQRGCLVTQLQSGSTFGEVALFIPPHTSPASYVASTSCDIYEVPQHIVSRICDAFPSCEAQLRVMALAHSRHLLGELAGLSLSLDALDKPPSDPPRQPSIPPLDLSPASSPKTDLMNVFLNAPPISSRSLPASTSRSHAADALSLPASTSRSHAADALSLPATHRSRAAEPESLFVFPDGAEVVSPTSTSAHDASLPLSPQVEVLALESRVDSLAALLREQRGDLEIFSSLLEYAVMRSRRARGGRLAPPTAHGRSRRCAVGECFHVA